MQQCDHQFDFDTVIDRRKSESEKWGRYAGTDILPMWVADMDFVSPPEVIAAMQDRVAHGVFGYSHTPKELGSAVQETLLADYNWAVDENWLVWLPGLVTGLNVTCRAVGEPGDGVMTATPVYPPFLTAPKLSGRELITVPLMESDEKWRIDFDALEAAVTPTTKLLMWCNPQNPVGRIFTKDELTELAAFCDRHDLVICSDEIHADLLLDQEYGHIPIATLDPAVADRTITLMAPSKTYNIAGLGCSFAVIPNDRLRKNFQRAMAGIVPHINMLAYAAAFAAYRHGKPWLKALLDYLRDNHDRTLAAINTIPGLEMKPVEATYLAWIDARALDLKSPAAFFEKAGVGLNNGADFGLPGFVRLNFGCPRKLLDQGLARIENAVKQYYD